MLGSSSRGAQHRARAARRSAIILAGGVVSAAAVALAVPAAQAASSYVPGTPQLAAVTGSQSNPAPWNEWQGDPAGASTGLNPFTISGNGASLIDPLQLLPTYEPAANSTAYPNVAVDQGANSADSDTTVPYQSGVVGSPGPLSGYCGSGDFDAETGLGSGSSPSVSTQPSGATLPLGPDYFPHVVLNADHTLTGYFDYRPKDENEAVLAATSTDGGKTWSFDQEALQQDAGYCASADTNDDGQGHPNVLNFGGTTTAGDVTSGGTNELFTLQRAGGDNEGVGMLVHNLNSADASPSKPLGKLASSQPTGLDPDTFDSDSSTVTVPTQAEVSSGTSAATLTVTTTGTPGTLTQLVAGGFVDLGANGAIGSSDAGPADVIQCTGVTASATPADTDLGTPGNPAAGTAGTLTGCEVVDSDSSSTAVQDIDVAPGDMIMQVIGYVSNQTPSSSNATAGDAQSAASTGGTASFPVTLPDGPNSETADGGYAQIDVSPNTTDATVTSGTNADLGFTSELTGQTLNVNAPYRYYIDGTTVYCTQANNNPTTEIEDCTIPVGSTSPSVEAGDPILVDPITPADTEMTTGLVSPDGIVGELHSFPTAAGGSVPANASYVMYTEKKVNYWVAGELDKDLCGIAEVSTEKKSKENTSCDAATISTASLPAKIPYAITFNPWEYLGEDFGSQITVTNTTGSGSGDSGQNEGTFTLSGSTIDFTMGDNTTGNYDQISCTGVETVSTPEDLNSEAGSASVNDTLAKYAVSASAGSLQSGAEDAFTGCEITGDTTVDGAPGGSTSSFGTNTMIAPPGAALAQPDQLQQTGEGKSAKASNADKLYSNNEDYAVLRAAWTTDGVNFYSDGLENDGVISGSDTASQASENGSTGSCTSDTSYTDLSNPTTNCNPENADGTVNLNLYSAAGDRDATEMRWPGSGGSIIYNPATGQDELFLSGAWLGDGDSDAFNQVYYATSTNGIDWSVPTTVVSTDYSFSASEAQDAALAGGTDQPVGISAYYSGRAYGPAVVPNPVGGGFWMVFAGYNVPKGAGTAGDILNPAAVPGVTDQYVGSNQTTGAAWTIGSGGNGDDPAMYRNILVDDIAQDSAATITFPAPPSAVYGGSATLDATSGSTEPISYTTTSSACAVNGSTVTYIAVGNCMITASQPAGDGYTQAATQPVSFTVGQAPLAIIASSETVSYGGTPQITASYQGLVNHDRPSSLSVAPTCTTDATDKSLPGAYVSSCSGAVDGNYAITYVNGVVTVTKASTSTELTLSAKSVPQGQPVRVTIDVGGVVTPDGWVTLYDGSRPVETLGLRNGEATLTLWYLNAGVNELHAVYYGDRVLSGSTSADVPLTVTAVRHPTWPRGQHDWFGGWYW